MTYLFDPAPIKSIPVRGIEAEFPIHRIFCVGRNYAAHAEEMGNEVDRSAPFYFTKSALSSEVSGATIPYPPETSNYHYEMELAIAIGAPVFRANEEEASAAIYGYCCALDMTRRDLQSAAKAKQRPWDTGKDVEGSAIFAPITTRSEFGDIADQTIYLDLNGIRRQDSVLSKMVHSVTDIVMDLSKFYHLKAGDVIMTGTPKGVGSVEQGDSLTGGIDGLEPISVTIGQPN